VKAYEAVRLQGLVIEQINILKVVIQISYKFRMKTKKQIQNKNHSISQVFRKKV
jgi:hypothetical protein